MTRVSKMQNILLCLILCAMLLITIMPVKLNADDSEPSSGSTENTSKGAARGNGRGTGRGESGLPNDQWPGFHGGSARTGNTTGTGGSGYFYELWNVNNLIFWSSPVVMYDQIYILYHNYLNPSSGPGTAKCYNMTGGLQWTFNVGNAFGSPLVYNSRVYFAGYNGDLYCLDTNATGTGTTTNYWTYNPAGVTGSASSPVTDGKMVYYSTKHSSGLHAVWITNGSKAWSSSLNGSAVSESSPAYYDGNVYCGGGNSWTSTNTGSDSVFCYNATSGELNWTFTTGNDVTSTPAIEYGRVYFGSMDGKIYCVAAEGSNGSTTKYWEYNTNAATNGVWGSASVAYGRVYIAATNSRLYCLDAYGSSGTTTMYWSQSLTPAGQWGICGSPAVTADYVYIGTTGNGMHCRNRASGSEVWSHTFPTATYGLSSPAIYKDMVIIASDNGYLYTMGVDKVSPKVLSTLPADDAVDVEMNSNITVKFDEDLAGSTLNTANFILKDSQQNTVPGTVTFNMGVESVYFTPTNDLDKEETYIFTITTDVKDTHDNYLDGNGNGIDEGVGIDEYEISFTTLPFYPPIITPIEKLRPTEDIQMIKNIASYISDADTDKNDLVLALNSPSSYVTLDGFDLHLLYPNGVTDDSINLSVSDNLFTKYELIDVEVKAVNDPPVLAPISPLSLTEDVTYSLNMETYLTDVDTPLSALIMWAESTEHTKKYFDKDGWYLNFTYPEGITSDEVNVTVYEGSIDSEDKDALDIQITVTPVNDAPELDTPQAEVRIDEDTTDTSIDLDKWFKDVDDTILTYSVTGNEKTEVTIASNGAVTIIPEPDWCGTEIVTFTAKDLMLKEVSTDLTVIIEAVNDPPVIIEIKKPTDKITIEYNETIDLEAEVDDKDLPFGDTLEYLWYDDEDGFLADTLTANDILLTPGEHIIEFTVRDENNTEIMNAITVTMKPNPVIVKPDDKPDPKPNGTDGGDGNDPKDSSTNDGFMSSGLLIGIILIVIIIIVVLTVLGLTMKKKKEKPEKPAGVTSPELAAQQQPTIPPQMTMTEQSMMQPGMQQNMYQQQIPPPQDMSMMHQYPPQDQYPDQTTNYDQSEYPSQDTQMTMAEQQQYSQFSESPQQYDQFPEQPQQYPQLPEANTGEMQIDGARGTQTQYQQKQVLPDEADLNNPLQQASGFSSISETPDPDQVDGSAETSSTSRLGVTPDQMEEQYGSE